MSEAKNVFHYLNSIKNSIDDNKNEIKFDKKNNDEN